MQIKSLRIKSYRSWKIDEREICYVVRLRRKKLDIYTSLREEGASHFNVSEEKAVQLMKALLLELPGFLVPTLVREEPGKGSKTPIALLI
jgi:hypothetical protein